MRIRHFISAIEHERIHRAIQAAEAGTSGRIVVYIGRRRTADAVAEGHRLFRKLGLETDRNKAGLLFFIAPKAQTFSIVGGTVLHERLGQEWWDAVAAKIGGDFKEGRFADGLLAAIAEAGRVLQIHCKSDGALPTGPDVIEE